MKLNFENKREIISMRIYDAVEKFVIDLLEKSENQNDIIHARGVVRWIKELKPDADEALLIAGVAHDIERAIYGDWKNGSDDPAALRRHQDLSALEIEKFLQGEETDSALVERVKELVAHHEEGGDEEQNILCDADCLSFFEDKVLRRVKKLKEQGESKEEIKRKVDYYFSRIISEKAQQIAQKWYDEALVELNM